MSNLYDTTERCSCQFPEPAIQLRAIIVDDIEYCWVGTARSVELREGMMEEIAPRVRVWETSFSRVAVTKARATMALSVPRCDWDSQWFQIESAAAAAIVDEVVREIAEQGPAKRRQRSRRRIRKRGPMSAEHRQKISESVKRTAIERSRQRLAATEPA